MNNEITAIIFDLDDTLYKEIDFLVSAYRTIAEQLEQCYHCSGVLPCMLHAYHNKQDAFQNAIERFNIPVAKDELLHTYRTHQPSIRLNEDTCNTLQYLQAHGYLLGLMSDGRSLTQRNKITALGLEQYFTPRAILISEEFGSSKPSIRNYQYFENLFHAKNYIYVGDNPAKDFVTPNQLAWRTICLADCGTNIHPQDIHVTPQHRPQFTVNKLSEIIDLLNHHEH